MKHVLKLLIIFFSVVILSTCASFDPELLRASNEPIDNKILPLMMSHSDETQEISMKELKGANYQSFFYTIFERELRQNIFKQDDDTYGNIELTIIYDSTQEQYIWPVITGGTIFISTIVGIPFTGYSNYVETEIEIFDDNNKLVKRYNIGKKAYRVTGLYYGYKNIEVDNIRAELFKDIMADFKHMVSSDAIEINSKLENSIK